ncbi:MAG: PIN domain-containing protein [Candidatus Wallbacteria bacterium]|nr:PIN domain-containing protein [Candidatus Wallbacteria bacterium]
MRVLVDTNIFLEVILDQKKARTARQFLSKTGKHEFYMTDFTLHSIGLFLFNQKQYTVFNRFVDDMFFRAGFKLIAHQPELMEKVSAISKKLHLDFDDAYQYLATENYDLTLVSFDHDFDKTPRGRKEPGEI